MTRHRADSPRWHAASINGGVNAPETARTSHLRMSDVARACRVSTATVSRALRDDPRIGATVRFRIQQMATELGYRPHPLVQALMVQRRQRQTHVAETIALVTSHAEATWKKKDVCRWYMSGLKGRASQQGYQLEVFPLDAYRDDPGRLAKTLRARNIRGAILAFSRDHTDAIQFPVDSFSVVGLSTYFANTLVDRVHLNGFANVKLALSEMRRRGYRRPALVVPARNNTVVGGFWTAAVLEEQRERPPSECCPPLVFPDISKLRREWSDWYHTNQPDAIIAYKAPVRELLRGLGLRVPIDVGVAQLFGSEAEVGTHAGINGQLDQVGAAAVDLLVQKLAHRAEGRPTYPRDIFVTGSWLDGPTVRPLPAQA